MAFPFPLSLLRRVLGEDAAYAGSYDGEITGIATLSEAGAGDLSFLGNPKYKKEVAGSRASVLLLPRDFELEPGPDRLLVRVDNPSLSLALLCREIEFRLFPVPGPGIHPSAVVEPGATVSPGASVGAFCFVGAGAQLEACILHDHVSVGRHARIGEGSLLFPRVVVGDHCRVGRRNRILAGAVLGGDGYGYEFQDGAHQRVPQVGVVETGDDVDIGANTTIDRARFGATRIGQGTKVDNLVQIAHNVRIGRHCLVVAQVGISGSTVFEDGVVAGGQAGIAGHLRIGPGAQIAGGSAVTSSLEAGAKVRGYPAEPMLLFNRIAVLQRRLPELFKRFDLLEEKLESLSGGPAQSEE
jgi:UDP-3-O-[3-hydroxymyristoyl] glucosamine N-acyltransferase